MPACPQASIQSATTHVEMEALEAVQGRQVLVARGTTKGRDRGSLPACRGQTDSDEEGYINPEVLKFLQLIPPGMWVRVYGEKGDLQCVLAEEVLEIGSPRSPDSCAATY